MKRTTKRMILVAVLGLVIIAAVYVITGIISKQADNSAGIDVQQNSDKIADKGDISADISEGMDSSQELAQRETDKAEEEIEDDITFEDDITSEADATPGATMIEDEGDIVIIVPDEMGMDGF